MYTGFNAPKFETITDRPTDLLTRVKSRDAGASKNSLEMLDLKNTSNVNQVDGLKNT